MLSGNALSMESQKNMTIDRLAQLGEERAQGIDKEVRGVKDGVKSVKVLVTGKRWTDSRSCRSSAERPVLGGPHTTVERTLCAGSWAVGLTVAHGAPAPRVTQRVTATHNQARWPPGRPLVSSRWATACASLLFRRSPAMVARTIHVFPEGDQVCRMPRPRSPW